MRVSEWFVIALAITAVIWPLLDRSRRDTAISAAIAVGAAVAGVLLDGARWQFYTLYLLLTVLLAWRLLKLNGERRITTAKAPLVGGLSVVLLSTALGVVLPVPSLPTPGGPNAIGTTSWTVVDRERVEVYDNSGEPRRVVAQAWYPTETAADPAPWVSDAPAFSSAVAGAIGFPSFALDHLALVKSNSAAEVPITRGAWPVVIYSHGWGGFRMIQSDFAEHLASYGFVVISLDHTYGAGVTLFPAQEGQGTIRAVDQNLDALPDQDVVSDEAYHEAIVLLEETFALDVAEVLDQLAAGQGPALLGSSLELDRVGLSGHSTGGGAMIRLCLLENRCAGVLGFDPWVEPVPLELLEPGLDVPLLSIRSEAWQGNNNDGLLRSFHERSPGSEGMFYLADTLHADFTLQSFLSPAAEVLGGSGAAEDRATHDAVNQAAFDFFDRHLRDGAGQARSQLLIPD